MEKFKEKNFISVANTKVANTEVANTEAANTEVANPLNPVAPQNKTLCHMFNVSTSSINRKFIMIYCKFMVIILISFKFVQEENKESLNKIVFPL